MRLWRRPGIHVHLFRRWIPGSLAALAPRNDETLEFDAMKSLPFAFGLLLIASPLHADTQAVTGKVVVKPVISSTMTSSGNPPNCCAESIIIICTDTPESRVGVSTTISALTDFTSPVTRIR